MACPPEASLKNRVAAPPVVRTVAVPAVLWLKNSNKVLLVILAFPAVLALRKFKRGARWRQPLTSGGIYDR
jgi:hypothetical protein